MECFKNMERKVTAGVFIMFGLSLSLFVLTRNQAFWVGFLPLAFSMHYYLYKSIYLKNYIGAFVELSDTEMSIERPIVKYKASVSFNSITEVYNSRSFFLPSVVLQQNNGQKIELVNFKQGLAQEISFRAGLSHAL